MHDNTNKSKGIDAVILMNGRKITKREIELIYYLIHGMTAKQIARAVGLSHRSIESSVDRLKKKLNCRDRYEIISQAIKNDLSLKHILMLFDNKVVVHA